MGCIQSTTQTATPLETKSHIPSTSTATNTNNNSTMPETAPPMQEYELKKLRPGCTGMFWRSDPTKKTQLESNDHWPKDGAKLRGDVVEVDGEKWLLAKQVQQKGSTTWNTAPGGAAMPFEYEDHYYLG
jgi:hypothetical protein